MEELSFQDLDGRVTKSLPILLSNLLKLFLRQLKVSNRFLGLLQALGNAWVLFLHSMFEFDYNLLGIIYPIRLIDTF